MVIGHSEMPGLLMRSIYLFHMPIFFISAGYFFNLSALDNPCNFIKKRFNLKVNIFPRFCIYFVWCFIENIPFISRDILNESTL
ncbi:hypothetical protein [uncultured Fibrobacter sp.]|uniref:hypothetical protein n=1 Tax=uncultured Fibrobacter sp. TaxID=261512 RepID=UPI0034574102